MAVVPLDRKSLGTYVDRVERVPVDARPLWGTMTAARMFAHLRRSLELSLGDVEVNDQSNFLMRTMVRWLVFHVLPWPKGKIKAPPDFFPEEIAEAETERAALLQTMQRFVDSAEKEPERIGVSPFFGPAPLRYWRHVHGKHQDHHLRQFGV